MEHDEFRKLLTVAKEFNVSSFRKGDIEVHFAGIYTPTVGGDFGDAENKPDPDLEFLKAIEDLKNKVHA